MSRRGVTILGLAVAGGAGYYLYSAGGDPKAAQKQAEADAHKLSAKVKSETSGTGKEAEKKGEEYAARAHAKGEEYASKASAKADELAKDAKSTFADAQKKAEEYKNKTGTELNKAIDKFDKSVEDGTAKAKSGISSWFGGK